MHDSAARLNDSVARCRDETDNVEEEEDDDEEDDDDDDDHPFLIHRAHLAASHILGLQFSTVSFKFF